MNARTLISTAFLLIFVGLTACDKESEHKVSYFVTNSVSGFTISYLDADGVIQTTSVTTGSQNDKVTVYTFFAAPGDIVYMSVTDTAAASFFKAMIYVDDKVYKSASRTDDNTAPLTVSGTIPY